MRFTFLLSTWFAVSVAACAATPGGQPHDMSTAEHDRMAAETAAAAARHQAEYKPAVRDPNKGCGVLDICWEDLANPTTAHQAEADRHRKMAADHRAASQALRDAEARACAGISELDRDTSPFAHRGDISSVELAVTTATGNANVVQSRSIPHTRGAVMVFRATPGMTAQWLQRLVDCHLARNAALGHDVSEMAYCPLVPKGVEARVTPREAGFAVEVTSSDPATVQEIVRRAQALVAR